MTLRAQPDQVDRIQELPLALLIDDDSQVRRLLRAILRSNSFRSLEASNAGEALELARRHRPDVLLVELELPDMTGAEIVRGLRKSTSAPILVISELGQEHKKVEAFEAGADDYITKPFGGAELVARMRAALRRTAPPPDATGETVIAVGALRLDLARRLFFVGDSEVHLTPIEYKLLGVLMRRAGAVISGKDLLEAVWGPDFADRTDYLRVYVSQLRQKLEEDPTRPRYLITEPAVGYRIRSDS